MDVKEKLAMLEDVLELDEGTLTPETELDDVDEYDSMTKLSIIVMIEDEFGVKLEADAIRGFKTVGDILAVMNK